MANQHTNPTPPEVYNEVITRENWRSKMERIKETIAEDPEKCVVWPASNPSILQYKTEDGSRHHIHLRRLYWMYAFGEHPSFGPNNCGTRGCVNPAHQRVHVNGGPVPVEPYNSKKVPATVKDV